ncbi:MAG: beta-lactamase family protein, partial [Clostridiales bacterium]|nr:beta-lactamase family protein [Clostridiales bacterium]
MEGKRSAKKKVLVGVLMPICALFSAFLILCVVTMCMYSPRFLGRALAHWDSSVTDYKIFPSREIKKSGKPYVYQKEINDELDGITVQHKGKQKALREFVKATKTTSFIIVRNDKIVYEQYANGYDENSVNTSFSMAKSVVSLLVGKAIENGCIESVGEPIENYIPEFAGKAIGKTTIEDLLLMRSDIAYDEDKFLWFGDDSLTYWHDDLRTLALSHTKLTSKYGGKFHYNNYHPLLLGIILERSTGVSVSRFFEQEIWQKIGAEHDASWSLDSKKHGFEKMESGINFRAADFLKIGSIVLHGGFWNGAQAIGSNWLAQSTLCE